MASMKRNRPSFKNRRRPDYVIVPNGFEPRSAAVGEPVKIGFRPRGAETTEWMWLHVVKKTGSTYVGMLANSGFDVNARYGDRISFTDANILTTWDNCPLRAMQDLAPLGLGRDALDTLRAFEAETGMSRRDAVAELLSQFETVRQEKTAA